jgi:sugar diacid utilization regulator
VDASELGYQFDAWHTGMILTGVGAAAVARRLAGGLGCELLLVSRGEKAAWTWLGRRRRLEAVELERFVETCKARGVTLVVGEPGQGFTGWRLTHLQARATQRVAMCSARPVMRYSDVALQALVLLNEDLADSFIDLYLAPLKRNRRTAVVFCQTLDAYFTAGCNVSATAEALGVSRGTLRSRMSAIERALGFHPDARNAELMVALRLDDLRRSVPTKSY